MKRLLASTTLIMLIATAFISGYFRCNTLPVYADNIPSGYSPAGYNDQVDAFKAYCKSRNLAIEGSIADGVTQVTSKVYQDLVISVGLDINELQNEIYKNTSGTGQQFFFTVSGISAMNRLFAELLQNQDLDVGDQVEQQNLYEGKWFVDYDGYGCLIYVATNDQATNSTNRTFSAIGSSYKVLLSQIVSNTTAENPYSVTFNLTETQSMTVTYRYFTRTTSTYITDYYRDGTVYNGGMPYRVTNTRRSDNVTYNIVDNGHPAIIEYNGKLYFGAVCQDTGNNGIAVTPDTKYRTVQKVEISNVPSENLTPTIVFITTNNTTINNNNYEGDTIINNEGDVITNNDPVYNPYPDGGGTITPPSTGNGGSGSGGTLTLPDVDLDLPEIDWSIGDLSDKFPFSIPFDLIAFFTVLNAAPETPELQGQVDLGIIDWEIDWSLEDFDNLAEILRNLEFIGFCIGLIIITRSLIKG